MRRVLTLTIAVIAIMLSSCEKELSKTELLCGKYWVISSITVDPEYPIFDSKGNITGYSNDVLADWDACDKDDAQRYNEDGTWEWDTKSKCDDDEAQRSSGTWSFNEDETSITEVEDGEEETYEVLELTEDKFVAYYEIEFLGTMQKFTITFKPE